MRLLQLSNFRSQFIILDILSSNTLNTMWIYVVLVSWLAYNLAETVEKVVELSIAPRI